MLMSNQFYPIRSESINSQKIHSTSTRVTKVKASHNSMIARIDEQDGK